MTTTQVITAAALAASGGVNENETELALQATTVRLSINLVLTNGPYEYTRTKESARVYFAFSPTNLDPASINLWDRFKHQAGFIDVFLNTEANAVTVADTKQMLVKGPYLYLWTENSKLTAAVQLDVWVTELPAA